MKIDVDDGNVLWYSIENETPTQIAVINLGGCFVLGASMGRKSERPVESVLKEHNDVTLKAFMVNDLHLSGNELIIFAVIYSFSQDGESYFYGSRKYLASWCQIHEGAVDYQLKKLLKKGLILKSHTRREDGSLCSMLMANMQLIESLMNHSQKFESGVSKICDNHSQKFETGHSQKFESNTKGVDTQADTKEDNAGIPFSEIIDYLNEKAHRGYKPTTPKTREHIRARWNEGYTLDDFKRVIDVKCAEWLGDPKMDKYLCPDTLFGTKFEKYLNQPMHIKKNDEQNTTQEKVDMSAYSKKTGTYVMRDGKQYVWIDEEHLEEVKENHNNEGEDFDDIPY